MRQEDRMIQVDMGVETKDLSTMLDITSLLRHSGLDPESSDVVLFSEKSLDTGFRRYDKGTRRLNVQSA